MILPFCSAMLGVRGDLKQLGSENQSLQPHHAQMQSSLGVENDSPSHFAGIYSVYYTQLILNIKVAQYFTGASSSEKSHKLESCHLPLSFKIRTLASQRTIFQGLNLGQIFFKAKLHCKYFGSNEQRLCPALKRGIFL